MMMPEVRDVTKREIVVQWYVGELKQKKNEKDRKW